MLPWIWIEPFLNLIGVHDEQMEIVKSLVIWSFPAMFFRVFNDNTKVLIQNMNNFTRVGLWDISVFFVWLPVAFLIMKYVPGRCMAFGIALAVYELACLIVNIGYVFKHCDPRCLNSQIPVTKDFGAFTLACIRVALSSWFIYIFLDSMTVIL